MHHRDLMNYIDIMLKDIVAPEFKHLPFGGKTIVIGGDFKQLSPVVPRAHSIEQIRAIYFSVLLRLISWQSIQSLEL